MDVPSDGKSTSCCFRSVENQSAVMNELFHDPSPSCLGPGLQTALHRAAMVGNCDVITSLIQGGCALDLLDRDGNTALHESSWHGFCHCVKQLIQAGADVHIRNKAGNTALHMACQNAHAQTARLLLLAGSKPWTKNHVGDTCLHVAARYDNVTLVKILLGFLCPVTDRNQVGDTALHVAAALNHKRTVQVLLEAGADGTVRNNAGKSALDKARDHNHKQVYLLLTRVPQNRSPVKEEPPSSEQTESRASVGKVVSDWQHKHQNQSSNETPAVITNCHSHKRKKRVKAQLRALNEDILSKVTNDLIRDGGDHKSSQNGTAYQLRTLYCDRNGDIQQATANGCYCKPALEKLEARLKVTQEEMRMQLLKIQEQVNSRLGKIDRSIRHQTIMNHELKRYRVSQLKDIPVHIPVKAQYYKLLPSPSVQPSVNLDLESQPLLSVVSGDSSASLATYINILPSKSVHSVGGPEQDQLGGRMYFEMKMNRSSDDYENTALFPVAENNSSLHLGSVGACGNEMKQSSAVAVLPPCREGVFSRQSSISDHGARVHHNEHSYDMKARSQVIAHRLAEIHTDSNRKLDFFSDQAAKSTFNQERNNLHAQEVTQLFFETVSAQLELWYERKIVEVEQQTELRAQQDRKELLLQISMLEEELQGLKTNKKEES